MYVQLYSGFFFTVLSCFPLTKWEIFIVLEARYCFWYFNLNFQATTFKKCLAFMHTNFAHKLY